MQRMKMERKMKLTIEIEDVKDPTPLVTALRETVKICDALLIGGEVNEFVGDRIVEIKEICEIREDYK